MDTKGAHGFGHLRTDDVCGCQYAGRHVVFDHIEQALSLLDEAIDGRCLHERMTGRADVVPPQVVNEDDDNVRRATGGSLGRAARS